MSEIPRTSDGSSIPTDFRWDMGSKTLIIKESHTLGTTINSVHLSLGNGDIDVRQGEVPQLTIETTITGSQNEDAAKSLAQEKAGKLEMENGKVKFVDSAQSQGGAATIAGDIVGSGSFGSIKIGGRAYRGNVVVVNGRVVSGGAVETGPQIKRRVVLTVPSGDRKYRLSISEGIIKAAELSGEMRLDAGNGHVTVEDCNGTIEAAATNGSIQIHRMAGDLTGDVTNGAITVQNFRGKVDLGSTNGSIVLSDAVLVRGRQKIRATNGPIVLGISNKDAQISMSTMNGAMVQPRDMVVSTDTSINEGLKEIEGYLGSEDAAENGPIVTLKTTNGSITVMRTGREILIEESPREAKAYAVCSYCGTGYKTADVTVLKGQITHVENINCVCCGGGKPTVDY